MIKAFSPLRPQSSSKGLALSRRDRDNWRGIADAPGGGLPEGIHTHDFREDTSYPENFSFHTNVFLEEVNSEMALRGHSEFVEWLIPENIYNFDFLAKFRVTRYWSSGGLGVFVRYGPETLDRVRGRTAQSGDVRIQTDSSNDTSGFSYPTLEWFYFRAQAEGDTFRARAWPTTSEEPSLWASEVWAPLDVDEKEFYLEFGDNSSNPGWVQWVSLSLDLNTPAPNLDS